MCSSPFINDVIWCSLGMKRLKPLMPSQQMEHDVKFMTCWCDVRTLAGMSISNSENVVLKDHPHIVRPNKSGTNTAQDTFMDMDFNANVP